MTVLKRSCVNILVSNTFDMLAKTKTKTKSASIYNQWANDK